ncbi:MAG: PAS domain S-box protein [Myxococcota bacterium]
MPSGSKVLVVDHDPQARRAVETALRDARLVPIAADDVAEGLEAMARERPDIVLVEEELPGQSGFDLLERIRSAPETRDVPVIVLTSQEGEGQITRAFEAGADDFLRKPVRTPELLARIRGHLRLYDYVVELAQKERDAKVMLELTQALASSLDFRDILFTVVRRIAEVVQVERVSIVLAPEQEATGTGYVVVASDDERLSNLELDLQKYPEIRQVLRTREPLTISDTATHPLLDGVREDVAHVGAMALYPIVWEDQAIGVLFLRAQGDRASLTAREAHFCQIVANATAVALRNARVMQSLRDHSQQVTFARFEAERRLQSLKRYADLFASAAEGIAAIDVDGRLLFANPTAWEMVGYSEEALRGRKLRELVHPDDLKVAHDLWQGFARGEHPKGVDVRIVRKDGEVIVCNCSFAHLHDGEGAVLISFRDVTEERATAAELRKTKEFLESLIDTSVDGIIAADMKGTIILFNKGAERIYGHRAEEVIGKLNARQLYPNDGAREVMKMLRSPQYGGEGKLNPIRMEALDAEGRTVPITISAAIIYNERGEPAATCGIFIDLREKLRIEERLAQAQEKLAMTEKQALIAELAGTTAHELNQPLTSIMAHAEMLRRKLDADTPEHRAAERMVQETERMADIVRKIGRMTKYETKSYVGQQKILDLDRSTDKPDEKAAPRK